MGLAANKFDLFGNQQVSEKEGAEFANKIDAIFSCTSAKESIGITPLFEKLGEKIVDFVNQTVTFDETMNKTKLCLESNKKKKKCCKSGW